MLLFCSDLVFALAKEHLMRGTMGMSTLYVNRNSVYNLPSHASSLTPLFSGLSATRNSARNYFSRDNGG